MDEELKTLVKSVKTKLSHELTDYIEKNDREKDSVEGFIQKWFDANMREAIEDHREKESMILIMMFDEVSRGNGVVRKIGDYYELNIVAGE